MFPDLGGKSLNLLPVKIFSEQSTKMKEQKKNKGSCLKSTIWPRNESLNQTRLLVNQGKALNAPTVA